MKRLPAIKSVMTPFPYSVDIDAPVSDALKFMQKHKIRHLPVTQNKQLVGLVSRSQLRSFPAERQADRGAGAATVRDANPAKPYVVDLNEQLDKVLLVMAERRLDSVLVTRRGKLAGVFTVTDACRSFAEHLRAQFNPAGGDEAA